MSKKTYHPFVSVCTPTFNRRPFIDIMIECFKNQTYPKNRIEWIIVDDGTDKIKDVLDKSKLDLIKYFPIEKKMSLGEKRNFMHKQCKGSIIVYMDDDDYYPPERISHAVQRLQEAPSALCAGSSELYIYFKHIKQMYQCGPYNPNHATAGTFAFRKELLEQTSYEDNAALAEEKFFLKDYTIPFVQLDPMKTILVFSHEHNTFDKRKLLDNPHPDFFKPSTKTVDMFICNTKEQNIKRFFMNDIDEILSKYQPGEPRFKPDVLSQIQKMTEKMQQQQPQQQQKGIMMERDGQPPVQLSMDDIVQLIQQLQTQNTGYIARIAELENIIKNKEILPPSINLTPPIHLNPKNKSDPEVMISTK
jgi:glycosyltransferase involved in cell wall biosynthesis